MIKGGPKGPPFCMGSLIQHHIRATEALRRSVRKGRTNEVAMLKRLSPYLLWLVLAIPALTMISPFLDENTRALRGVLHGSGEFAARFMIISLMATPLLMLTKGSRFARWLRANRRYFGVAAFAYAAIHTLAYVLGEASLTRILSEATEFDMWTGWLAFAIFIPLAATSMDYMVRKMGTWWKPLQRWTYAAAVLSLLHWASLHDWNGWVAPAVHFAPLAALTLYRLWWTYLRVRPALAA
jgi:sulfoxide reductase heme-binding subunit YedZ